VLLLCKAAQIGVYRSIVKNLLHDGGALVSSQAIHSNHGKVLRLFV
jgi:hypothetical protein